jgi:hypothetical protein
MRSSSEPDISRRYLLATLAGVAVLFMMNLLAAPYFIDVEGGLGRRIAKQFMMNQERNLPTLFNYALIVVNGCLLAAIAWREQAAGGRWWRHWAALAGIFLLLSFDEAAQVHERFQALGGMIVEASGIFAFAWVVPIVPLVLLVGLCFVNFLRHQPRGDAGRMLLAAAVFGAGAVAMDMVGAANYDLHQSLDRVEYHLIAGIEEALEMCGMALFGHALLRVLTAPAPRAAAGWAQPSASTSAP